MSAPELTYGFYRDDFHGTLDESGFTSALVLARAKLVSMTGEDIPEIYRTKWLCALSELVERVSGAESAGTIKSESVGSVSYTYADAVATKTDYDAVLPYLAGTGLLFRGVS